MNFKKLFFTLLTTTLLFSCNNNPSNNEIPKENEEYVPHHSGELNLPTVDVENFNINLPTKPERNYPQSEISTDGTYDYINIYEISDFHGSVEYNYEDEFGLSKIATYLETLHSNNPGGTVLLSTGDMFQGSCESNLTRGYMVNYAMNYMGFDAMAIGNHEFDWSDEWIKKNASLKYNTSDPIPYLCANLIDKRTNERPDFVKSSVVIERGDYKIGIIGTIGEGLESSIVRSSVENYQFLSEGDIVKAEAASLKNNGCDIVVWLSHSDIESMQEYGLTKEDGIDAAFGGHSHVFKFDYTTSFPYAQSVRNGGGFASIKLKINKTTKEVSNSHTQVIDLSYVGNIRDNADIKNIMNQYNVEIDNIKNIELGYTKKELSNTLTGKLKDIFVDSMQLAAKSFLGEYGESLGIAPDDAATAYHNVSGGIRSSIDKGIITYGELYKALPFDNELVLFKRDGNYLRNTLRSRAYSDYAVWHSFNTLDDIDTSKDDYYVITTDFLAPRFEIEEEKLIHTGIVVRDEIAKYIYKKEVINEADYSSKQFRSLVEL